jgi:prevent-host-death family protein
MCLAKEVSVAVVTIHEAKTNLSKLIARAEAGEEIVIARGKEPVVRLAPLSKSVRRVPGVMEDAWPEIPDAFWFDPLPEEELALWEGNDGDPSG